MQFPHHENEIAQSEAAHDCKYVNYWMHNGFIRVDDEKMSKSLGNFFTIRDVLKKFDAEVVRFFILRAHYRSPLNYSDHHLNDAKQALTRLYTTLKNVPPAEVSASWEESYASRFKIAMDDDFNTPEAFAILFELANEANRTKSPTLAGQLKVLANLLGLLETDATAFLQGRPAEETADNHADSGVLSTAIIEARIQERLAAKKPKILPKQTASEKSYWSTASFWKILHRVLPGVATEIDALYIA